MVKQALPEHQGKDLLGGLLMEVLDAAAEVALVLLVVMAIQTART
jgi:hypothetical protein